MWAATLPGAPVDEVLHVSALRTLQIYGESGSHRIESWIDDTNRRGLSLNLESDGSLNSKTLVLGNQLFRTLDPKGITIFTQTLDEFDAHLLGPKSDLWAYRSYYETGAFEILEGEPGGSTPIRFAGGDPSHSGARFEATLDPSTLLLTQLTTWSAEGEIQSEVRMDIDYELIETIPVDSVPAGLFDPPPPDHIVKRYIFMTPAQAQSLDFDVYYLGTTYGEYEIRNIFYHETPADSAFLTNPGHGVWITYQPPGTLFGESSIGMHSQPVDPDATSGPPRCTRLIEDTCVTVQADTSSQRRGMLDALRVLEGAE